MGFINTINRLLKRKEEVPEHSVYKVKIGDIDGNPLDLSSFKGKKLLVVNVASECGLTQQYEGLQSLYESHKNSLEIIGVPCNDFAGQEPGNPEEIRAFCTNQFNVSFTLTEKVRINSEPTHPLYEFLMRKNQNGLKDSEVEWNFQKYLLNESGVLIEVFAPAIEPLSEELQVAIRS